MVLAGVFNTSPNGGEAGIWMGAGKPAFEPDGSAFFFETGNGSADSPTVVNSAGFPANGDYYEAVVKVVPDPTTSPTNQNINGWGFKAADYFIPYNQPALDNADQDLGYVTAELTFHINFSASKTDVPQGYLNDVGAAYRARVNGLGFGWNVNNAANMIKRNDPAAPDQLQDSLGQMQAPSNPNAWWAIALPDGTYQVHLVAGDPDAVNSNYQINVSDAAIVGSTLKTFNPVLAISGTPTSSNPWIENTVTVTVTHGVLAISNAAGAINNKIDAIDIVRAGK